MIRGTTRTLALSSVVLLTSAGCDALTVHSFAGSVLQMTLEGAKITPPGTHLEIWARDQYNDIIRLAPFYDESVNATTPGLMIRQAISVNDPCMTDDRGNLLITAAAYPTSISYAGVTQTPEQQAQQRVLRIQQLTPAGNPLLAVLPWDEHVEPTVDPNAAAPDRKATCDAYRNPPPPAPPTTYIPNPDQITAPLHGTVYGFVGFTTVQPPTNYDGIRLDTAVSLKGVQEIFITTEGTTVDPNNRGPLYVTSKLAPGGRDILQFELIAAQPDGPSGALAVYTNLDEDPVQF
jgi:hypothetical protein